LDSQLKSEVRNLLLFLAAIAVILKIVFYKQDIITTTRTAFSMFWMFTLPGYALMHLWKERMDFGERIVIGTAAAAAVTAIFSYYLGLTGLQLKYHWILLPIVMLSLASIIIKRKK
jgi:uncharacterized membrane protein